MAINHLPPEILRDILLRLPIKTLTTARFVNKCWFRIISSSEFVTARLKNSTLSDHRVILPTTSNDLSRGQLSVETLLFDSSLTDLVNAGNPEIGPVSVWLEGSCNGLVCIVSKERWIVLWNPCTGKYNKLHLPNGVSGQRAYINYGFGYDESSDDYKVVVVVCRLCSLWAYNYKGGDMDHCTVHVYSLKNSSWKTIQDFEGGVLDFCKGKLVSGKVHWLTNSRFDKYFQRNIVSFDLGSEVFGLVELPIALDEDIKTKLDVLEDCICLFLGYEESHADLWIMKEYGLKRSWEKVVAVSYVNVFKECNYVRPWSVFPNGELLFRTSDSWVLYNPKDGSSKLLDIRKMDSRFQPLVYVPSLVSPVGT